MSNLEREYLFRLAKAHADEAERKRNEPWQALIGGLALAALFMMIFLVWVYSPQGVL